MLDPPGPLHCIWPKTKLIVEDGDVRDRSGWVHRRAARLMLGVMLMCVNVCASGFDHELGVGVIAQTSEAYLKLRMACFSLCIWKGCLCVCKLCLKS